MNKTLAGRKLIDRVQQLIYATATDQQKLLGYYRLNSLAELTIQQAHHVIPILEKRLK